MTDNPLNKTGIAVVFAGLGILFDGLAHANPNLRGKRLPARQLPPHLRNWHAIRFPTNRERIHLVDKVSDHYD
jgi:hypothetical protein